MPAVAYISLAYVRMAVRRVSNPEYLYFAHTDTLHRPILNFDGRPLRGGYTIESRRTVYP